MEALLSSGGPETDILVGPLQYGLDKQGSYIQARRSSSTYSNVNQASPAGVKAITINCGSSSEWMDPSSVLLSALITNNDLNHELFPATPEMSVLFDRLQIRLSSTLVEDVQEFGKLTHIMSKFSMDPQKKMDMAALGFGTAATTNSLFKADSHEAEKIPAGGSKRIYMKFDISGLLSQHKLLPLFALGGQGLQIQLSLAPADQAMIDSDSGTTFSTNYPLSDIRLLADMITLDSSLSESYTAALLNGNNLKIPIKSWECIVNHLPADSAGSFDIAISKSYTRMATLFCTFNQNPPADNGGKQKIIHVNTNFFPTSASETVSYHLALGSRRVPDNDVRGTAESWYRLQGALGLYNSLAHSTSVDYNSYKSDCYMIGVDTEKMPMVSSTGENLSTGQTIFLRVKGMGSTSSDVPRRATVCMHFDSVIVIHDTLVEKFD